LGRIDAGCGKTVPAPKMFHRCTHAAPHIEQTGADAKPAAGERPVGQVGAAGAQGQTGSFPE
jgi:hypothetical protein